MAATNDDIMQKIVELCTKIAIVGTKVEIVETNNKETSKMLYDLKSCHNSVVTEIAVIKEKILMMGKISRSRWDTIGIFTALFVAVMALLSTVSGTG